MIIPKILFKRCPKCRGDLSRGPVILRPSLRSIAYQRIQCGLEIQVPLKQERELNVSVANHAPRAGGGPGR